MQYIWKQKAYTAVKKISWNNWPQKAFLTFNPDFKKWKFPPPRERTLSFKWQGFFGFEIFNFGIFLGREILASIFWDILV